MFKGLELPSLHLGSLEHALSEGGGWWLSESQLDLDFANDRAFNRSTGFNGSPNSILTYTSPSPKMVWGDDGLLGYAPHNLALNSGFTLGTDGDIPTYWLERGVVTIDRDAAHGCAVVTAGAGGTVGSSDDARQVISGLVSGFKYVVRFKAQLGAGSIASVMTGVFAGSATNCALTNEYQDFEIIATASGTSHSLFLGNQIGAVATVVANVKDVQVERYPAHAGYVATTSAAKYDLPVDHDPLTGEALGVLIEEQRTNLLLWSQEFDNASWTKNESSISATNITAPDDTATAELLASNTNNAIHYLFVGSPPSITSGVTYTGSVFLKKGSGATAPDWMQLSFSSATFGSTQYANFNLTTGEVGAVGSGATATIEDVGGGWYRCSITATATSTSGGSLLVVFTNNNDALGRVPAYADATTSNVCVWGAQLEAGAFPTSYIPTVASQVTRAADQVSILTSAFGYNAAAGTMALAFDVLAVPQASLPCVAVMSNGTNDEVIYFFADNSASTPQFTVFDGAVGQVDHKDAGFALAARTETKTASAYAVNDFAFSVDARAVQTDVSGTLPTVTTLYVGARHSSSRQLNGHIKRLTYFPTRRSNAELQELSS